MTTRDRLIRTRRWAMLLVIPGCILLVAGGPLARSRPTLTWVVFLGFAMFAAAIVSIMFTGRCVNCGRLLGRIFSQAGGAPWSVASDLQFCPYCGVSID